MKKNMSLLIFFAFFISALLTGQEEARLLRFPDIHGSQIVFSSAGDLYTAEIKGGLARKLTSHIGYEMFAKFSPDGKYIAFTGQYDGNTEVFVIPATGGVPRRLTYTATLDRDDVSDRMGPNNIVMGWTPDGKNIVYRSRKQSFNAFRGQLFTVPFEGGLSEEIPLSNGGFCSYSPDGGKLAFNWVFREFRTWKYYEGGMADDLRIFDFKTKTIAKITDTPNQEVFPMWIGDEIFFLSDRDRRMNLFVYNTLSRETSKITNFNDYDIKFPSSSAESIIFEKGGFLYHMEAKSRKVEKINVIIADDALSARTEMKDVSKSIRGGDMSPNGERVVFAARGEIFNVPSKAGITYNLTQTPGVHERNVNWSPDGKTIAYLSDKSGEFEIWLQNQDGSSPAVQLTKNADTYIFNFEWSPDSKKILYHDRKLRLKMVEAATGKVSLIETGSYGIPGDYQWSPDSKWVAYTHAQNNDFGVIRLYNTLTGEKADVTDSWYDSGDPAFSDDGKYLFFVSVREFNPVYGATEWNHVFQNMNKICLVTLEAATPSPFAVENDKAVVTEEKPGEASADASKDKDKKDSGKPVDAKSEAPATVIDLAGIQSRILALPVPGSNYGNLRVVSGKVYYNDFSYGQGSTLKMYDLTKKKETELGKNMNYTISANGKKMLLGSAGMYQVVDLPSAPVSITEAISLSGLTARVDYRQEWAQIFDESWRQMRDFFYVENMHGVDWPAMKLKYGELVPCVKHRDDLTYVIGEMIAELSVGHAYINSGEKAAPVRIKTGLLGIRLNRHASGYFEVKDILEGGNWSAALRSPLTEPGNQVKEGEFILAVNGNSTKEVADIYMLLGGAADKETELTVNSKPIAEGSRKVIIKPVADESALYYYEWVQRNIRYINEKTNGEIGYLHIPDMGPAGLTEFGKYFYPQLDKKGLIIDDRGNGGGNVSPMIIERLQREVTRATMFRNLPEGNPVPSKVMPGPKVLLVDRYSASDGDLFPYAFKKHNLGTVIGTRTWGGVVGITGPLPFIDGQDLRKPEFASYSSEKSEWIIEGYGVEPDIFLDNDPHQEYLGRDAQLDKAIEVILEQIKNFTELPAVPVAPDKSK